MRAIILFATLMLTPQQSSVPQPPPFTTEKLWVMYGQTVAEGKVQEEYIRTLQAKITELSQKLEACEKK